VIGFGGFNPLGAALSNVGRGMLELSMINESQQNELTRLIMTTYLLVPIDAPANHSKGTGTLSRC
jgi:hypothetical protein